MIYCVQLYRQRVNVLATSWVLWWTLSTINWPLMPCTEKSALHDALKYGPFLNCVIAYVGINSELHVGLSG
jgi:hypothetical protein